MQFGDGLAWRKDQGIAAADKDRRTYSLGLNEIDAHVGAKMVEREVA